MSEHRIHARNLKTNDQVKHFLDDLFTITAIVPETHDILILKLRREDELGVVESEARVHANERIAVYFPEA